MLSAERTAPKTVSPALRGSRRLPVWPGPGCPPPRPRPFAECGTRPTRSRSVRAGSCLQLLRLSSPGARWTHLQKGLRLPGPGSPREPPPPDATRGANPGGGGPLPRPSALAHRLFMLMLFVALPEMAFVSGRRPACQSFCILPHSRSGPRPVLTARTRLGPSPGPSGWSRPCCPEHPRPGRQ